jgi:hypothetical protein
VTSDENMAVGFLLELPSSEGSVLLRAARLRAAVEMLRRSGFSLVLLPDTAAFQMQRRRRWWRASRVKEER